MRDKFKDIVADTDGDYEAIAEHYMEIYAGTSLTEDQVWEEMICDSLADMNIFSKSKSRAEAAEVMSTAIPAIQQAVSETKGEATKADAQVEGKASRSVGKAKYLSYNKVGIDNVVYIKDQLRKIYEDLESGIADEIAIAKDDTVYIIDSGKENGKIQMGIRKKFVLSNADLREEYIRRINNDAVSKGRVSDELSSKLKREDDNNRRRDLRRESGAELSVDQGKPEDQQSGVSAEDADKRGVTAGKASRELDLDYMSAVNRGDMKTAQRMVDEAAKKAGYDKLFYHGSKKGGGFTKFRDWQYFTENKQYAERYTDRDRKGSLYTTYVKLENPFDTRKAKDRKLFNEIRQEYGLSDIQASGLPDWTDGYDISDYIDENGLDYDGIVLDEGGDMVNGKPVSRGESYVVRKSAQIKSADPVTYDDDGNVIPLSERFNPEQSDIRFSRELDLDYDENIEATKTLTNRDILVNALENVTQSQDELDKLREYKKNIEQLNKKTFVLGKLKEEIKAMSFGKGQRDIALPQNQPQQQKASPGIDCRERLSFLEDIMDKASLLEFLSERNLQLHSEYLENCRMRLSILEKSGYSIGGKSYPELFRARLGGARDEILPFAREVYLHELYFDSFGMVGECAECLKSSYRSVAGFLYELECAAMAADGGFLLVTRGKSGVSISHNTGITSRLCAEPRLAIDLAEHAYFLDYGFDKLSYVRAALSRLRLSKLNN